MSRPFLLFASLLLGLGPTCQVPAAEVTVKPGPGALETAIEKAETGDVLILSSGVWREHIVISKPLTLKGMPGAVLEGSEPLKSQWTQEGDSGIYVTPLKKRPYGLLAGGKFVAELRLDRAKNKGDWHWHTLLEKGPPLSGFEEIRALWVYHADEQKLYARFKTRRPLRIWIWRSSKPRSR